MRIINSIARIYNHYRAVMWVGSLITSIGAPLLSYGMYALNTAKYNHSIQDDNPELAAENTPLNPIRFLKDSVDFGMAGNIARYTLIAGLILVIIFATFAVISNVVKRTTVSGKDEQLEREENAARNMDEDTDVDDYGEEVD